MSIRPPHQIKWNTQYCLFSLYCIGRIQNSGNLEHKSGPITGAGQNLTFSSALFAHPLTISARPQTSSFLRRDSHTYTHSSSVPLLLLWSCSGMTTSDGFVFFVGWVMSAKMRLNKTRKKTGVSGKTRIITTYLE